MTPPQCKTAREANAAAEGVFEARCVVAAQLKRFPRLPVELEGAIDDALRVLMMDYYRRAADLEAKKPKPRAKAGGRKR